MSEQPHLVIVMVGLPARGKSYITKKIQRFYAAQDIDSRIFNCGSVRRQLADNGPGITHDAQFFDPNNKEGVAQREYFAQVTLGNLAEFLNAASSPSVAIFDATNSSISRRAHVSQFLPENIKAPLEVIFLESLCNDINVISRNVELKLQGPDYVTVESKNMARNDFWDRLHMYEKSYVTVDAEKENVNVIKIVDAGNKPLQVNLKSAVHWGPQIAEYLSYYSLENTFTMCKSSEACLKMQNVSVPVSKMAELLVNLAKYSACTKTANLDTKLWPKTVDYLGMMKPDIHIEDGTLVHMGCYGITTSKTTSIPDLDSSESTPMGSILNTPVHSSVDDLLAVPGLDLNSSKLHSMRSKSQLHMYETLPEEELV